MAKNTAPQQSTGWSPSFSASSISSEVPVLSNGIYAGKLTNVSIVGKENKQYFAIRKAQQWDRDLKAWVDVIENGEQKYILAGMILVQVVLTSKKAIKVLGRDEPNFIRMLNISFDGNFQPDVSKNQQFKNFLTVLGLENEPFETYVNFEFDPEIAVPSELESVPNVVTMLNALNYYKELFSIICNTAKDNFVKVSIERSTKQDESIENIISGGRTAACGFLKYEEGCENDYLEEAE